MSFTFNGVLLEIHGVKLARTIDDAVTGEVNAVARVAGFDFL